MENLVTLTKNPTTTGLSDDGITVNAYGQGQCSGATFTCAAHMTVDVDFTINMLCVTPDNMKALDSLILSMLSTSKKEEYKALSKSSSSGGSCFFGLIGRSTHSASTSTEKMTSFGLTTEQQTKIIDSMLKLVAKTNKFSYKGTVSNTEYDYSVSGNLFAIIMDCTISKGENHNQIRMLAPNVHLNSTETNPDGSPKETLPVMGKLY